MSNIFEALEQAGQQPQQSGGTEKISAGGGGVIKPTPAEVEKNMLNLYQNIQGRLQGDLGKTVLFISTRAREGSSVLLREMAKVAALKLSRSVLLLDANQKSPSQCKAFQVQPGSGWEEAVKGNMKIEECAQQIGGLRLFVSQVAMSPASSPSVFDLPETSAFFASLKSQYDLILIDAPPSADSGDGVSLARMVDGTVIVLEAEKTRWQVADELRGSIEQQGGSVLGTILNKRRHIIPEFIYKRL